MSTETSPEWLPDGWTAVAKTTRSGATLWFVHDPSTGSGFYSKEEVLKHLQEGKISNHTAIQTRSAITRSMEKKLKKCLSNSLQKENNIPDSVEHAHSGTLPPGWIKESRPRKYSDKKDPFYIDPVSGYEFRSLKDAFRYIETGDIERCLCKPKKRRISDLNTCEMESPLHESKIVDSKENKSEKCLFTGGKHNLDVKMETNTNEFPGESQAPLDHVCETNANSGFMMSPGTKRLDWHHEKEITIVGNSNSICHEDKESRIVESDKHKAMVAATETLSAFNSSCLSKLQSVTFDGLVSAEQLNNGDDYIPCQPDKITNGLGLPTSDENLSASTEEENLNFKKPKRARNYTSSNTRSIKTITMPLRSSPRLAALRADTESKSELVKKWKTEAKPLDLPHVNSLSESHNTSDIPSISSDNPEILKKTHPSFAEAAPLAESGINIDNPVSKLTSIFGNSWSDPCLEFAFKTLIGDLPALDNTSIFHDCSQQQQQQQQQQSSSARSLKD
ncbi:uncharacterized protein LOC122050687 [Zingiber officinale]|uniref:uncharacterized protein LOC122050687 n=1 Tax=Zingiber officinale TaxID=94328 RepID=UPI001C4C9FAF|nr:uncharacterized protein LOC122050687 [Zingiber officinale]